MTASSWAEEAEANLPLTGKQITHLAEALEQEWDLPTLELLAADLAVKLFNLVPSGDLKERAIKLITYLNSRVPPRDRELLELLRVRGNATLKAVTDRLLKPAFFSPTGDPHDAILLGRTAFVAREELRQALREFTNPSHLTTRVLVVRGNEPGGKSYSWEFLRHLAFSSVGASPLRLRLRGTTYTPREFLEQAFMLLGLAPTDLPELADDPQLARIDSLINAFKGRIGFLAQPYWLVIDDLNEPSVTPAIRDTAYAMAYSVEELRPQNLWIALLGYNDPIVDNELRYIARDDAEFPRSAVVAKHFELIARSGPRPLASDRAREIADLLFTKFPKLDKEAMNKLTTLVEGMGEKLRLGLQP